MHNHANGNITNQKKDWYRIIGRFDHGEGNRPFYVMLLIACLLSNIVMNINCNCLVLQSGEWRKTTFGWDSIDGTKTIEGLSFYEMELAAH